MYNSKRNIELNKKKIFFSYFRWCFSLVLLVFLYKFFLYIYYRFTVMTTEKKDDNRNEESSSRKLCNKKIIIILIIIYVYVKFIN